MPLYHVKPLYNVWSVNQIQEGNFLENALLVLRGWYFKVPAKRIQKKIIERTETLTRVLASIWAPRSSKSFTMLAFPLLEATCRGVIPFYTVQRPDKSVLVWQGMVVMALCSRGHRRLWTILQFYPRFLWLQCFWFLRNKKKPTNHIAL